MTNEEAKKIIIEERDSLKANPMIKVEDCLYEAFEVAIKALEQEPCEDCISREEVNTLVDELARKISDERCFMSRGRSTASIMQDILDLPSVTPKIKKGQWLDDYGGVKCSCCGYSIDDDFYAKNYCTNCGSRMEVSDENSN